MADDTTAKNHKPGRPSSPKKPNEPPNNPGDIPPAEDGDFFDEISSQIDSLKAPSEDPDEGDGIVEVTVGSLDSESEHKESIPKDKKTAKAPPKATPPSPPRPEKSKKKPTPTNRSAKKTSTINKRSANKKKNTEVASVQKKKKAKAAASGAPSQSRNRSEGVRTQKKSPAPKPAAKKMAPQKKAGLKGRVKPTKTPEDQGTKTREPTDAKPSITAQKEGNVDFDEFLADVSADIENVKDRFETTKNGESGSDEDGSEIVEYDLDEWFLPDEQESTKPAEVTKPATPVKPKAPEKKAPPRDTAEPKRRPSVPKKPPATKSTGKKTPPLKKLKPLPSAKVEYPQTAKKAVKRKPIPTGKTAGAKIPKSTSPAPAAKQESPLPFLDVFNDEQDTEDVISHHLVQDLPRRSTRRRSTKLIVGGRFIVVLILAAGFLYLKDPFGLFKTKSAPPPAAQKTPAKPAKPSLAHKVPSKKGSPSGKRVQTPSVSRESKDADGNKPFSMPIPEPKAAPATVTAVTPQPPPKTPKVASSSPSKKTKVPDSGQIPEKRTAPPPIPAVKKPPPPVPAKKAAPKATLASKAAISEPESKTPNAPFPPAKSATLPLDEQVKEFLNKWASAWEKTAGPDGDFSAYMACYSDSFTARGMNKAAWKKDKQSKNRRKKWISIGIRDVSVAKQAPSDRVKVTFSQEYSSSNYSSTSPKTLVLAKEPKGWKIIGVGP